MFSRTPGFDKLLDKATSHLLMEPDWQTILQICDLIRQNDVPPKFALHGIKKKLLSQNPHTAMFAVELLESMVKNCGSALHDELTSRAYCDILHEVVKTTTHDNVRTKLLELMQAWTFAFRKNSKYGALKDTLNLLRTEGYKFPALRESDAMFSSDTAPEWADGDVCHRCRVPFTLVVRKHHCRACGQVFCAQCSSKNCTLPKFGIEKEVRVCDTCYDQVNKPASVTATKDADMVEYLKSSLAQQSQVPPRKSEEELREEEEFQLALALSQSEAEHKEKEKMRVTNIYASSGGAAASAQTAQPGKDPAPRARKDRSPSPASSVDDVVGSGANPELARYLNRGYWEGKRQSELDTDDHVTRYPSAPSPAQQMKDLATTRDGLDASPKNTKENGLIAVAMGLNSADLEMEEFIKTLKSQVEIFINRMKSNSSRGRSIATDSSVQTLFMNITAMHSRLLRYIQQHDDSRLHYERLQDKLTQVKDARAALDALRDEHREKLRRQAEEAERQRQLQMAHKLDIMRKKKQEYLQYQRQLALQRIQEQEREMQMRHEQQKQQYLMSNAQAQVVVGGGGMRPPFGTAQGVGGFGMPQQQPPPPDAYQAMGASFGGPPMGGAAFAARPFSGGGGGVVPPMMSQGFPHQQTQQQGMMPPNNIPMGMQPAGQPQFPNQTVQPPPQQFQNHGAMPPPMMSMQVRMPPMVMGGPPHPQMPPTMGQPQLNVQQAIQQGGQVMPPQQQMGGGQQHPPIVGGQQPQVAQNAAPVEEQLISFD